MKGLIQYICYLHRGEEEKFVVRVILGFCINVHYNFLINFYVQSNNSTEMYIVLVFNNEALQIVDNEYSIQDCRLIRFCIYYCRLSQYFTSNCASFEACE